MEEKKTKIQWWANITGQKRREIKNTLTIKSVTKFSNWNGLKMKQNDIM